MKQLATLNRRLGGDTIWSRQLAVSSAALFAILTLFFDCVLQNNWSPLWIPTALAAYLESFFLVVLMRRWFLTEWLRRTPKAWLNLLVAGVVGALHNLTVAAISLEFGLITDPLWAFRVVGGFQLGFFFLLFFGITFGARLEHRALVAELSRENERLTFIRGSAVKRLNQERRAVAEATRGALIPRLEELQRLVQSRQSRLAVIDTFRQILLQEVRPVNEELQKRAVALEIGSPVENEGTPKLVHLGANLTMREVITPVTATALGASVIWAMAYMVMGQPEAGTVLLAGIAMFPILWVARRLSPPEYRPTGLIASVWMVLLGLLCSALPLVAGFLISAPENQNGLLLLIPVALSLLLLGMAEAASLDHYRVAVRDRMAKVNEAIEYELALFDQKIWITRRAWQFVVHGSVQAALTAALTRMQDPTLSDTELMLLVEADLERALKSLEDVETKPINLAEAMAEIQATWAGVCRVAVAFSDRANHALLGNNDASICVNEIVKEAVNNAVRHGKARSIDFDVDVQGSLLTIKSLNDGEPLSDNRLAGFGSQLMDELSLKWSLKNNKAAGKTEFKAVVPLR
ncbi:MAG: hypothetical protein RL454_798 [Actinomycetota bacterium]